MKRLSLHSGHALCIPLCLLALTLPTVGCGDDGGGGGGTDEGTATEGPATAGDTEGTADETGTDDGPGEEIDVIPAPGGMRRLTPNQYRASVGVLLGDAAAEVADPPSLPQLGHFDSHTAVNESLTPTDIERYESSAMRIGTAVQNDHSALAAVVPCVAPTAAASCYDTVAEEFGRLAWRRPLTAEEISQIVDIANAGNAWGEGDFLTGIKYEIAAILQSPNFLYVVELGEPTGDGDLRELGNYEMASRLSFFLLGHTPDGALLDTAEQGQLTSDDQVRAVAQDLLERPEARERVAEFYDELYRLRELDNKGKDDEMFPTFTPELAAAMRQETLLLLQNVVFEEEGNFLDVYDANYTFVNNDLAALYGMAPPDFPWQLVPFPEGQARAGFLSHPAFLTAFSHSAVNSPTRRGLFVQETLLCTTIEPPPPDVNPVAPTPQDGQTLREWLEQQHNAEDSCAACHGLMDPVGFAFENYDAIGGYRMLDNGLPIDSSGNVPGLGTFADAQELAGLVRNDPRTPTCVVRNLYRSTLGHDDGLDQLEGMTQLNEVFAETEYDYKNLMVELTVNPLFRLVDAPK